MNSAPNLRKIQKIITFMKMTERIASLSYDSKHQVGSMLVKNDFSTVVAIGYNGNHRGGINERESEESGKSGFLHAEENVLIKANISRPEDYTLFVTMTPCRMCAKRIVNKEIREVVYLTPYTGGGDIGSVFREGGVQCRSLHEKLLPLFLMTELFADAKDVIERLQATDGISEEDWQAELYGLLCAQLGAYFGAQKVEYSRVSLDTEFPPQLSLSVLLRDYSYALFTNLYRLS